MCPNPRPGPALGPAGALLSAVHISVRASALGSGFSELLLHAVRTSAAARLLGAPETPRAPATSGHWLRKNMSLRAVPPRPTPHPHPYALHTCHQTGRARLTESSLLTSSADK